MRAFDSDSSSLLLGIEYLELFNASSSLYSYPIEAALYTQDVDGVRVGGWCADGNDTNPWLQVKNHRHL